MIAQDIIYLISEYNKDNIDSIKLSLINKETYDNSDKILLNYPFITNENYKTMIRYKFNKFKKEKGLMKRYIYKLYQKRNIYLLYNNNYSRIIPNNIKKLIIDLTINK